MSKLMGGRSSLPERGEWLLLLALLSCLPLSLALPAGWSKEGGILENAQVLVLLGGFFVAMVAFLRLRPGTISQLALAAAPVWIVLAARELSWGRALLSPAVAETATMLQAMAWYRPATRACAIVLMLFALYQAWRGRIDLTLRQVWSRSVPWLCFAVIVTAALGSTCAEGHMHCNIDAAPSTAQLFEELCELLAYVALFWVQASIVRIGLRLPKQIVPQHGG